MKNPKIEININGAFAQILIDGKEITDRVGEYTLIHKAGELPQLHLTFNALDVSVTEGEAHIIIPPSIRSFFNKYGTTEETAPSAYTD